MNFQSILVLILFAPIYSSFVLGFLGSLLGSRGSILLSTSCLAFAALLAWLNFFGFFSSLASVLELDFGLWCGMMSNVRWKFVFDATSSVMLVVITTMSALVHLYSSAYMRNDPHLVSFFCYLSLFTSFMLILVLSSNLVLLFVGWEGVGLCSYLLVNFWFTSLQANKAALKAIIANRVGDVSIILSAGLLLCAVGSMDFSMVTSQAFYVNRLDYSATSMNFLILIAAIGKSAQMGLHVWLPDAMEGPTPVSALIHAATMVTAGVYLIIRLSIWYSLSSFILNLTVIVGGLTAVFAGTVGLFQNDIKKVIAYSTCSQLGYMMLACGCKAFNLSLFHLFNHAFFKALLFLSAGSIMHALSNEQDMRKYGGLRLLIPVQYAGMLAGSLALMGTPYLTGFYSKDVIPEVLASNYGSVGLFGFWLSLSAAFLTVLYSVKVIYWTFYSRTYFGSRAIMTKVYSITFTESFVVAVLSALSVFMGFMTKDRFIGLGSDYFGPSVLNTGVLFNAEFLPTQYKFFILFVLFVAISCSLYFNYRWLAFCQTLLASANLFWVILMIRFLTLKWFFDMFMNQFMGQVVLDYGYKSFWVWDKWILEQGRVSFLQLRTSASTLLRQTKLRT